MNPIMFKISILWGSAPEPEDTPITYEFATKGELTAFLDGVEAASGWLDYEIVEEEPAND